MPSNAQRVREFHLAMGLAAPPHPTLPPPDLLDLRRTLIEEECREVLDAFDDLGTGSDGALAHLAGELADLLYVTYGALVSCGIDADTVFAEVHAANMRKAGGPRRPDGKALKPPDWRPPDVAGVISRQAATPEWE